MNYVSVVRPNFAPIPGSAIDCNFLTGIGMEGGNVINLAERLTNGRSTVARYYGPNRGGQKTAAAGKPRFAFHPRSGEPRGLQIEQASNNFMLASNDFAAGSWFKVGGATVTAGVGPGLNGLQSAWLFSDDPSGTSLGQMAQFISISGIAPWCGGFHIRRDNTFVRVYLQTTSTVRSVIFDLANGRVLGEDPGAIGFIEAAPFDMWRCAVHAFTASGDTTIGLGIQRANAGDPQSAYVINEAFLENRPGPSSLMPTTTSIGTRAADTYSLAFDPGLLNPAELTIFAEIEIVPPELTGYVVTVRNGTAVGIPGSYIDIYRNQSGPQFVMETSAGASISGLFDIDPNGIRRLAGAFRSGLYAAAEVGGGGDYVDGAQGVLTSGALTALPTGLVAMDLGHLGTNAVLSMYLRRLALIPRALGPAELTDLLR